MQTHTRSLRPTARPPKMLRKRERKWRYLVCTVFICTFSLAFVSLPIIFCSVRQICFSWLFSSWERDGCVCIFRQGTKMDENMMNKQIQLIRIEYKIITVRNRCERDGTAIRIACICVHKAQQSAQNIEYIVLVYCRKWRNETNRMQITKTVSYARCYFLGLFFSWFPVLSRSTSLFLAGLPLTIFPCHLSDGQFIHMSNGIV